MIESVKLRLMLHIQGLFLQIIFKTVNTRHAVNATQIFK